MRGINLIKEIEEGGEGRKRKERKKIRKKKKKKKREKKEMLLKDEQSNTIDGTIHQANAEGNNAHGEEGRKSRLIRRQHETLSDKRR